MNDKYEIVPLNAIGNMNAIILTKKIDGNEEVIALPDAIRARLFEYFTFDVEHNHLSFQGFDCYAFISFLRNVQHFPPSPQWSYEEYENLNIGDVVVLTNGGELSDAIQHWALFLREDFYLSKFGRAGEATITQLAVMSLQGDDDFVPM